MSVTNIEEQLANSDTSDTEKDISVTEELSVSVSSEIDLFSYHEHNAGRLVIDPEYVHLSLSTFAVYSASLRV